MENWSQFLQLFFFCDIIPSAERTQTLTEATQQRQANLKEQEKGEHPPSWDLISLFC